MHHVFTNSTRFDEDIKHDYKVYLYEFLYLKWRFDSLVSAIKSMNYVIISINQIDTLLIIVNYSVLFAFRENILYFLIGQLIAGFYSAFVLIGNHER